MIILMPAYKQNKKNFEKAEFTMDKNFQSLYAGMIPAIVKNLRNGNNLAQVNKNPRKYFKKYSIPLMGGVHYEILINNDHEFYFVIPEQSNDYLNAEQLQYAIGGTQTLQSMSSASSFSSIGSILSFSTYTILNCCVSTFSSLASIAATASTASSKGSLET